MDMKRVYECRGAISIKPSLSSPFQQATSISTPPDTSIMKLATVATVIAAAVLCSVAVEAAPKGYDKKCTDQDMIIQGGDSIQCGKFRVENNCGHMAKILQPSAKTWIKELNEGLPTAPRTLGCFTAIKNK